MRRWVTILASSWLSFGCTQQSPMDEAAQAMDEAAQNPSEDMVAEEDDTPGELIDMSTVINAVPQSMIASTSDAAKTVFGKDMRTLVKDTSIAPYSSTVMVRSSFADAPGKYSACTGAMIAPNAVLTAAHCVFNAEEHGGSASYVLVSPGAYVDNQGKQRALSGVGTLRSSDFMFPFAYSDENGFDEKSVAHDYAVIRLPNSVPSVGVRKLAALRDPINTAISMTAYHGDLCTTQVRKECASDFPLYVSTDIIRNLNAETFDHRIDLIPFASGAGISTGGESGPIVGVQSSQSATHNSAARLTEDKLINIRRWANIRP